MIKRAKKHSKKNKRSYKVQNWSQYNRSLIERGSITFWFNEEAIAKWLYTGKQEQGAPLVYDDTAIRTMLIVRSLFHMALRNCQGFVKSVLTLMNIQLPVPDYSTICRRQKDLDIPSVSHRKSKEPVHVVIDSTGLKVFGEGEWKVRKHGYSKHRMWRKLHLAVDPDTGAIMAQSLTTNSITDADEVPTLLNDIKEPIGTVSGDGAYDRWKVYHGFSERAIHALIPPRKDAKIKQHKRCPSPPLVRDEAIRAIRALGRQRWKETSGYFQRNSAENTMFRYKTLFGDKPLAHTLDNQKVEVDINCMILNRFIASGSPISCPVVA